MALTSGLVAAVMVIGGLWLAASRLRPDLVDAFIRATVGPAADPLEDGEPEFSEVEAQAAPIAAVRPTPPNPIAPNQAVPGRTAPDPMAPAAADSTGESARHASRQRPAAKPLARNLPGSSSEPAEPTGAERPPVRPSRDSGAMPRPAAVAGPTRDDAAAAVAAALEGQLRAVAFDGGLAEADERDLAVLDAAAALEQLAVVLPRPLRVTREAAGGGEPQWMLHGADGRPFATITLRSMPAVAGRSERMQLAWTWLIPRGERAACAAIPVLFRLPAAPRRGSHEIWMEPNPFLTRFFPTDGRDSVFALLFEGGATLPHLPLPRCEGRVRITSANGLPQPFALRPADGADGQFRLVCRAGVGDPGVAVELRARQEGDAINLSCRAFGEPLLGPREKPLGKRGLFDLFVQLLGRPPTGADSPNALFDRLIPQASGTTRERREVEKKIERFTLEDWIDEAAGAEGFAFYVREHVEASSAESEAWRAFLQARAPRGRVDAASLVALCLDEQCMRDFLKDQPEPSLFHDVLTFLVRIDDVMAVSELLERERVTLEGISLAACLRIGLEAEWVVDNPDAPGGTSRRVTPWARIDPAGESAGD